MAFKMSVQKYSGKISEVEIGKGEKAIKILYHFIALMEILEILKK